ncbi:MAG: hypothetical protein HZB29_06800 [Nitrospinae bacterium]|nr:hypothetical protein [Nitrospinota bacterium]
MAKVDDIKLAIEGLPDGEYAQLRQWFTERDWREWDERIENDSASGKLDFLVNEALAEKRAGLLKGV